MTKKGKIVLTLFLSGVVIAAVIIGFIMLNNNKTSKPAEHTHSYTETMTKTPTCIEKGEKTYTCDCGDSYAEEIPALGHDYTAETTAPTCTEQGFTTYTCSRCGDSYTDDYVAKIEHDYEWTTTKEPTETEDGIKTGVCKLCGDTITKIIPATNHEHTYVETIIEPTCTESGYTTYTCNVCGYSYTGDYTNPTGHTPDNAVQENYVAPDCMHNGSYDSVVYCAVCEEELLREQVVIPATGVHNYVDGVCIVCGEEEPVANPYTDDSYFTFTLLYDNTYEIKAKDVNNMPAEVILPSTHGNKPVTSIGDMAFRDCGDLTNITIPDSVTSIGYDVFSGCSSLTKVYYGGTSESWDNITIVSDGNDYLFDSIRYYYSENYPVSFEENTYWYYVDGVPTVWEELCFDGKFETMTDEDLNAQSFVRYGFAVHEIVADPTNANNKVLKIARTGSTFQFAINLPKSVLDEIVVGNTFSMKVYSVNGETDDLWIKTLPKNYPGTNHNYFGNYAIVSNGGWTTLEITLTEALVDAIKTDKVIFFDFRKDITATYYFDDIAIVTSSENSGWTPWVPVS